MDLSTLVPNVIAAFDDAAKLVRRIHDRGEVKDDPQSMQDLMDSLSLGPVVVRGYFNSDVKRFGDAYKVGDPIAREQMKDVLIQLQMVLLNTLRMVLLDDERLDCNNLQATSDDCRVNAGVCLGQFSQRLSENQRMFAQNPPAYGSGTPHLFHANGLYYPNGHTAHSPLESARMRSPEPNYDHLAKLGLGPPPSTFLQRQMSSSSSASQVPSVRPGFESGFSDISQFSMTASVDARSRDPDELSVRRPSSHTLAPEDSALLSPLSPDRGDVRPWLPRHGVHDVQRDSAGSSNPPSGARSPSEYSRADSYHSSASRERHDPEDPSPANHPPPVLFRGRKNTSPPESRQSVTFHAGRGLDVTHSTLEHVSSLESIRPPTNPPPTNPPPRPPGMSYPPRLESHPAFRRPTAPASAQEANLAPQPLAPPRHAPRPPMSATTPIMEEPVGLPTPLATKRPVAVPDDVAPAVNPVHGPFPATSSRSPPRSTASSPASAPVPGSTHHAASPPPTTLPTGPITLPTDKNLLGFCKGAFRMFAGMEKKAFCESNRPVGYSAMVPFWRCDKCFFEGPMSTFVNPSGGRKGKTEKKFDSTIRELGGVRYKWAFLAKCHVTLKSMPEGRRDGSFGSFGCMFCAAEAATRGWPAAGDAASTTDSMKSGGKKDQGGGCATPTFGNLQSFVAHLQTHRRPAGWPNAEMQMRMKCVVGRVADKTEDCDVNLMPVEGDQ